MSSNTFAIIKNIVIQNNLNKNGFSVRDILDRKPNIKENTLRTFIAKHSLTPTIYFKRIGPSGSGIYKIKAEFITK